MDEQRQHNIVKLEQQLNTELTPQLRVSKMNLLRYYYDLEGMYDESDAVALEVISEGTRVARMYEEKRSDMLDAVHKSYMSRGKRHFDDYMISCEWHREKNARFWLPRRKVLEGKHHVVSKIDEFRNDPNALFLGFSMPPGTGKQLADYTEVLTSEGIKRHGDLRVGDEVISPDGSFVKVTHVFPKALQNVRITFTNGEIVDCHENHEWYVYDRSRGEYRIIEAKELFKNKIESGVPNTRGHRYRYQLPLREYVCGKYKQDVSVPPYTLGAWLGDGTNTLPLLTNDKDDTLIIDRIVEDGYSIGRQTVDKNYGTIITVFKGLNYDLQSFGMCHSRKRCEKHIPDVYFTLSVEQRLDLLAGLIDTDGTKLNDKNGYRYTTTDERLRDDVVRLVSTFGWRCSVTSEEAKTSTSGIHGRKTVYRVSFQPTLDIPCVLERKKLNTFSKQRRISICKVERIEPVIGNCIEVEGGMYCVGKTLIPTHNSTLIKFFLAFICGISPNKLNMYVSYSDGMVKMMYNSVSSILTDDSEYGHGDVFQGTRVPDLSGEYNTISYRRKGDFPTLGLVSLSGSVTGRTRANNYMITDDLVKNAEMARSPERLNKLYEDYKSTLTTRMIGDNVKQLMLGTIWSVHDPISRMKREHENDPRYQFIAIPVWDEVTHVSNFHYDHPDRYTTTKIQQIKDEIDPVIFECMYMSHGIEREGIAFPAESLSYFNGTLPEADVDKKAFAIDVAWGGGDSLSCVIGYLYGETVFIVDVVFNRGDKKITQPLVTGQLLKHRPHSGHVEANNGGDAYAEDVNQNLISNGYYCSIIAKKAPTTVSKMARIEQHAPTIRDNFVFLDKKHRSKEYDNFMSELTTFTFTGTNLHDDAADSCAMLADHIFNHTSMKVTKMRRESRM